MHGLLKPGASAASLALSPAPCLAIGLALAAGAVPALAQEAPEEAKAAAPASFPIYAFDVVGVQRLPQAEVERAVYPFMGENRQLADIQSARKAVQDAYAKAGYEAVLVDVPPQERDAFEAGIVRLSVSEVPVANVSVSGAKHHSAEAVQRSLPSIRPGEPLNFAKLQREIEQANRVPDREIMPAFDAGAEPGTIDVDLQVRDSLPYHASLELNNDNSPNTKPLRLTGSARYTNLWGAGHSITLGGSIAPQRPSDNKALFASYLAPLLGSPWTLVASGYVSNSDIAALGGTNVLGDGYQVGLQAIYRLPTERNYHAFRVGIDYKDFKQNIVAPGQEISGAPIRYIPLTLGYDFSRAGEKSSLDIGLASTLGLRVIRHVACFNDDSSTCVPEDQFTNRGQDSIENFTHINLDASYTRSFAGDWVTFLRFSGQYADSHLVSNEQFSLGGITSMRGYYQSEIVGDRGINGTLELRAPSLATYIGRFVDDLRVYVFADGGIVSLIDPLPDTTAVYRTWSLGGGVRLKLFGHFSGEALVGVPMTSTLDTEQYDPRFTFLVKGEF